MNLMGNEDSSKRALGQYFTEGNPFALPPFLHWLGSIPGLAKRTFIEPFAGSNGIVAKIREAGIGNPWKAYDIDPPKRNEAPDVPIEKRDCLSSFPDCENGVILTNPPYLARNSATRRGLPYPDCPYDDEYKQCLALMLKACDWVAAIIPESFLTSGLFLGRIASVIELPSKMFSDTSCPVCLALFCPTSVASGDFLVYRLGDMVGLFGAMSDASSSVLSSTSDRPWRFNDPDGTISILCVDGTKGDSIRFDVGQTVGRDEIKVSSRTRTRVSLDGLTDAEALPLIAECNRRLAEYRKASEDVFMTSFKGVRSDGRYRRRLDFETARRILDASLDAVRESFPCKQ